MVDRLFSDAVPDPAPKLREGALFMLIGLMAVGMGMLGWRGRDKDQDNSASRAFFLTVGIMGAASALAGFVSLSKGMLKNRERSAYIKEHTRDVYEQHLFDQRQENAMFDHIVFDVEKSLIRQNHFPNHDLICGDKSAENAVREIITQNNISLLRMYGDNSAKNVLVSALTTEILSRESEHLSVNASTPLQIAYNAQRQGTVTQQYRSIA